MVHNGIEYGLMAAYAEGLNVLKNANAGLPDGRDRRRDRAARPPGALPLRDRRRRRDRVWRRGSVIASWLLDLTAQALAQSPDLDGFAGRVSDSGEGRWTAIAAIEEGVPAPVLTTALYSRFASRDLDSFANKAMSAMRSEFGGHDEKAATTGMTGTADVLVIFGITGDLAKVMTFRSLYRLERRGLLHCPIVGVASSDWTLDQLREHAKACIVGTGEEVDDEVFARFAERLSYVSGDFGDAATYERVRDAMGGASTPVFYLEIPPFLFGSVIGASTRPA